MGTKIATLRTAFVKYLIMLLGGLGVSVIIPFLLLWLAANLGIINYANRSEELVNAIAPVLASTPDLTTVTESMPAGCNYLLLDKTYNILETTLDDSDLKAALKYATEGVKPVDNGKQLMLITRDNELIILQYYIGSRFINPWLNNYFPSPEIILYALTALNCILVCVFLTTHFSRRLRKQLEPVFCATEEISSQNLDFKIGQSNIKEFEDILISFAKMRDSLKKSLEEQWKAEQSQKEQIAALAHDLKTPLTIIQGNTDLLSETVLDKEQRLYTQYISDSSEQMKLYIKILIDISRAMTGYELQKERICFLDFWKQMLSEIDMLCKNSNLILNITQGKLPDYLTIDKVLIERAIINIVSNATDYAPPDTSLYVEVNVVNDFLSIRFTDCGCGFTDEALKHALDRFYMGDQSRGAKLHFGMGLFIAASIMKQHDGKLSLANSERTHGAQVTLAIPMRSTMEL